MQWSSAIHQPNGTFLPRASVERRGFAGPDPVDLNGQKPLGSGLRPRRSMRMTIARKATLATLIAALLATSSFAIAQQSDNADDQTVPAIEEPMDDDAISLEGDDTELREEDADTGPAMRGPGRRADRMLQRLDQDGSGDISVEEFSQRRLGWLSEADADGDGVISMEELTSAIDQRRQERREARLLARFDINGDGEITIEELERHQEKRFALMDRNDDGVLTADEMPRRGEGMRGPHGRMGPGKGGHHGMMERHGR
jgi:hypothetical protein